MTLALCCLSSDSGFAWAQWNHFGCIKLQPGGMEGPGGPTETLMKAQADKMVSSGMAKAGYLYINIVRAAPPCRLPTCPPASQPPCSCVLPRCPAVPCPCSLAPLAALGLTGLGTSQDDCWQLTNRTLPWENPKARQIANPYHFPNGMKHLVRPPSPLLPTTPCTALPTRDVRVRQADYIHSKGLRFGVYTARCRFTCQLFAASFGHEAIDAQQWAEWGVVRSAITSASGLAALGRTLLTSNSDGTRPVSVRVRVVGAGLPQDGRVLRRGGPALLDRLGRQGRQPHPLRWLMPRSRSGPSAQTWRDARRAE